jgi:uncharacterized membrane protein
MSARQIAYVALLAATYVVLGQVTGRIPNPMVGGGSNLALNMVVVVIAGILLGSRSGALVGFVGTLVNAVSPAGNQFEWAAIIPHTIMGFSAGVVGRRLSTNVAAFTIIVGHVLNVIAFVIARLLPFNQMAATIFTVGLLTEAVVDVVLIMLAVPLLRPLVKTSPQMS